MMGRAIVKDDNLLNAVKAARLREKEAISEAKRKFQEFVEREAQMAHAEVISAIRSAVIGGQNARQIGFAYGSTDPTTIKRLIAEATDTTETKVKGGSHPDWILTKHQDGTFTIKATSLGDTGMSGMARFAIDDDGENFSYVDGDEWLQLQLYRLGYKEAVIEAYYGLGLR
jgi:hypothetical protein